MPTTNGHHPDAEDQARRDALALLEETAACVRRLMAAVRALAALVPDGPARVAAIQQEAQLLHLLAMEQGLDIPRD